MVDRPWDMREREDDSFIQQKKKCSVPTVLPEALH